MSASDGDLAPEDFWRHRHAIERQQHPPSVAIHHDVDVVGGTGFPLRNGACLVEPGTGFGWNAANIAHLKTKISATKLEELPLAHDASGTIDVLLSFPGAYTYGHWPVDIAARIERVLDVIDLDRLTFIVPGPLQPWMRFHLDAYGIAPEAVITVSNGQRYYSATLYLPLVRFSAYLPSYPHLRAFARLKSYGHALATKRGRYGERIFVRHRAQTSAGARNALSNEDEIGVELGKLGFLSICPANMTMDEQISAFSEARFVVGEASSALHNIIYSTDAKLIVLNSPSHRARLHLSICKLLGHHCDYLFGHDRTDRTFSCDVAVLRDMVLRHLV